MADLSTKPPPNCCPRCKATDNQIKDAQGTIREGRKQEMVCGRCHLVYAIYVVQPQAPPGPKAEG